MAVRLFVHGVTVAEWTRRYGVEPFSQPCASCGALRTTSLPFVQGTLRGLQASPCPCGYTQDGDPYVIVRDPKVGDLFGGSRRLDE